MEVVNLGERLVKVTLAGRLDTQGVNRLETRFVAALVPGANNAIVDLSGVDFVASMGIRMLIAVARSLKQRQARLALFGTTAQVKDVFAAVSLQKLIPVCATETDALAFVTIPRA
jgi:anti-anti-sigma factor